MHLRDFPNFLNGLGIPWNIWFRRFTVTYIRLITVVFWSGVNNGTIFWLNYANFVHGTIDMTATRFARRVDLSHSLDMMWDYVCSEESHRISCKF